MSKIGFCNTQPMINHLFYVCVLSTSGSTRKAGSLLSKMWEEDRVLERASRACRLAVVDISQWTMPSATLPHTGKSGGHAIERSDTGM